MITWMIYYSVWRRVSQEAGPGLTDSKASTDWDQSIPRVSHSKTSWLHNTALTHRPHTDSLSLTHTHTHTHTHTRTHTMTTQYTRWLQQYYTSDYTPTYPHPHPLTLTPPATHSNTNAEKRGHPKARTQCMHTINYTTTFRQAEIPATLRAKPQGSPTQDQWKQVGLVSVCVCVCQCVHAQFRDLFFAISCGTSGHVHHSSTKRNVSLCSALFPALQPALAACRPIRKLLWLRGRVSWNLCSVRFYWLCLFLQHFSFLHRIGRAIVSKEPRIIRGPQNRLVQLLCVCVCVVTDFE